MNSTLKSFFYTYFLFGISLGEVYAQFQGPVGSPGSPALFKDTNLFKSWATSCSVIRGFQNITDTSLGRTSVGNAESAVGKAGETGGVVSLGDGGHATLTFAKPISNGEGADFAVFENGFSDEFLELAFVEVSSDGNRYVRFPSVSNTQNTRQIGPFDNWAKAELLINLAGKYRLFYGTPFDLEELKDSLGIKIDSITHIRIIDVIGNINAPFAQKDSKANIINDPFPTAYPSGGFDLDAIGVIHERLSSQQPVDEGEHSQALIYPCPANDFLFLKQSDSNCKWQILNGLGKLILEEETIKGEAVTKISVTNLKAGSYYFKIYQPDQSSKTIQFYKL